MENGAARIIAIAKITQEGKNTPASLTDAHQGRPQAREESARAAQARQVSQNRNGTRPPRRPRKRPVERVEITNDGVIILHTGKLEITTVEDAAGRQAWQRATEDLTAGKQQERKSKRR